MKNLFKIPKLNLIRFLKPYKVLAMAMLLPLWGLGGFSSCSLFLEPDPTLPPITQNGANTFGCLVNGKVFAPRGSSKYPTLTKDYAGSLTLIGMYVKSGEVESSAGIATPIINQTGEYVFENEYGVWYSGAEGNYGGKQKPVKSKLIITKFERGEDKINNLKWLIVSGTFEATLVSDKNSSDTIKITQGRFDVKFN